MTNTQSFPPIDPQITGNAAKLIDAAVALGSANSIIGMRDQAENALAAAKSLVEALEIETQGGRGALEDGYTPADRPGVIATIRRHLINAVADRLTWRDDDGSAHLLWSNK